MRHIHYFKKSYEIEQKFYECYSDEISHQESSCKVPKCFGSSQDGAQVGYLNNSSQTKEEISATRGVVRADLFY